MPETKYTVTFQGKPLTLEGTAVEIGKTAPDCMMVTNDLKQVKLSQFKGKKVLISAVPSLDTPVCDMQTKRFNQEALALGDDVIVLTVSMDLPFAQKRWCLSTKSDKVTTLSDYRGANFGKAFGILIKELHLLTRSIFLLDKQGMVRYVQIVPEISKEPDYAAALGALKKI